MQTVIWTHTNSQSLTHLCIGSELAKVSSKTQRTPRALPLLHRVAESFVFFSTPEHTKVVLYFSAQCRRVSIGALRSEPSSGAHNGVDFESFSRSKGVVSFYISSDCTCFHTEVYTEIVFLHIVDYYCEFPP